MTWGEVIKQGTCLSFVAVPPLIKWLLIGVWVPLSCCGAFTCTRRSVIPVVLKSCSLDRFETAYNMELEIAFYLTILYYTDIAVRKSCVRAHLDDLGILLSSCRLLGGWDGATVG